MAGAARNTERGRQNSSSIPAGTSTHLFCKQLHADGTATQNIPVKESDKVTAQIDVTVPTHCSRGKTSSLIRFLMEKRS